MHKTNVLSSRLQLRNICWKIPKTIKRHHSNIVARTTTVFLVIYVLLLYHGPGASLSDLSWSHVATWIVIHGLLYCLTFVTLKQIADSNWQHISSVRSTVEPRWLEHRWLVYHGSFLSPYEILPIAQENKYLRNFLILSWNCMLCVPIRIALSRRF